MKYDFPYFPAARIASLLHVVASLIDEILGLGSIIARANSTKDTRVCVCVCVQARRKLKLELLQPTVDRFDFLHVSSDPREGIDSYLASFSFFFYLLKNRITVTRAMMSETFKLSSARTANRMILAFFFSLFTKDNLSSVGK